MIGLALTLLSAAMIGGGGDPFAVALVAAVSFMVLALGACPNRTVRLAGLMRAGEGRVSGPGPVEDLRAVDHDCPVLLSVIRR